MPQRPRVIGRKVAKVLEKAGFILSRTRVAIISIAMLKADAASQYQYTGVGLSHQALWLISFGKQGSTGKISKAYFRH